MDSQTERQSMAMKIVKAIQDTDSWLVLGSINVNLISVVRHLSEIQDVFTTLHCPDVKDEFYPLFLDIFSGHSQTQVELNIVFGLNSIKLYIHM